MYTYNIMDLEAYLKMYRATTCTASTKLDLIFIVDAVAGGRD